MLASRSRKPVAFPKFAVAAASVVVVLPLLAAVSAQSHEIQQM
jgi:hypothetical protein